MTVGGFFTDYIGGDFFVRELELCTIHSKKIT